MRLFIVESPGKIKTISQFVDRDIVVKASVGHCYQIEPSDYGVDVKNNFEPKYVIIDGKKKVVDELKALAKRAEVCFIATDADREGESIGWHLAKRVVGKSCPIKRIKFHEITKTAINYALEHPGELDENLFNAQQARSVLDLLVGFKVSPRLWKNVASGTSAGRVQSIGLRIIVDRQKEIDAFVPEEYWTIEGLFKLLSAHELSALYKNEKIKNKEETDKILDLIKKVKEWRVKSVEKVQKSKKPAPPFETSSLQQFASAQFDWDGKKTMSLAQKLYEAGLITYHRTDCLTISDQALGIARDLILKIGPQYLPVKPIIYKSSSSAQEAHEAIRPVHLEYKLEEVQNKVPNDEFKLYDAIFRRFIACQMSDAKFDSTKILFASDDDKHIFSTNGNVLAFDGFLLVWTFTDSKDILLPEVKKDEKVNLANVKGIQHFTKPPAAYNDGSLIEYMKKQGIGRPSTYASIIDTLQRRAYVEKKSKAFIPTALGKSVCGYLTQSFPELMNINYTARMEVELDEIANAQKVWQQVVGNFYNELKVRLDATKTIETENSKTDILCPTCKKFNLAIRRSRYGEFYGCMGFSQKGKDHCDATYKIGTNKEPVTVEKKKLEYLEGHMCKCGSKLVIRTSSKTGKNFAGCASFPKCKNIYTMEGELIEFKK